MEKIVDDVVGAKLRFGTLLNANIKSKIDKGSE
jgi:hypothetical protein